MSKSYKFKYDLGDIVYLITDLDQLERMVTGIKIRPNGVIYSITHSTLETEHYELELTSTIDMIKHLGLYAENN